MDADKVERVRTTRINLNIAARVLDTTNDPDLIEGHVEEYVLARAEHDKAVRAAARNVKAAEVPA